MTRPRAKAKPKAGRAARTLVRPREAELGRPDSRAAPAVERVGTVASTVERGRYGRMVLARIRPNVDLVQGVERVCASHGVTRAVVRSAVGSLVDAALGYGEGEGKSLTTVTGPGIEILSLAGEVLPGIDGKPRAVLRGTISDADAKVYGGEFVRGANPICITLEVALQEWIPEIVPPIVRGRNGG